MAREIIAVSRDIREYIPKDWLDEKGEPELKALVFKFKPLSKKQLASVSDNSARFSMNSNTVILGNAENMLNVFRIAVTGWDNLIINGQVISYKKDMANLVDEDIIEDLPLDIIEEVGAHIVSVSKVTDAVLKK